LRNKSRNSQEATARSFAESKLEYLFHLKNMRSLNRWEDSLWEMSAKLLQ